MKTENIWTLVATTLAVFIILAFGVGYKNLGDAFDSQGKYAQIVKITISSDGKHEIEDVGGDHA